jgi:hypothetical protein
LPVFVTSSLLFDFARGLLVVAILKRELLSKEFIERTVDKIIEIASGVAGDKAEKTNSINKELVDVTTKANNLLNAIMTGLDSEMAREKLKELENQKQALNETLRTIDRTTDKEINRDVLIAELSKDAEALISDEGSPREVIQKYVSKIILSDTTVEITGMSDKYVSNTYCGGAQPALPKLLFGYEYQFTA